MARTHALRVRAMALARLRGELCHIRPKLHKCVARSRPLLGARAWLCVRTIAVARPRPSTWCSRTNHWKDRAMDHKRKSKDEKGKGKLAMPPTRKSPRLVGLPPFVPPTSPKSVLRPNKLLVLAIAVDAVEIHPKARGTAQAPVEKPPTDIKGKKTARISVKPLRKWFFQRIIARGGPCRPKPKKAVIIDLVSDEEEETQEKAAMDQPPVVANQEEPEDEEEDPNYEEETEEEDPEESVEPEETPSSYSLLSPFPATLELAPGEYDDPHN
ncbi:hypothetical protein PIB30_062726 [Stylosanthes scabra]|uniref:Uncharacterized protein n=1 Tax=Stylosanthes scabra TaxID=79078 RepID=A0ABU6VM85_9FABA|nr:hypothetical protein [Stylosanthes scabra]